MNYFGKTKILVVMIFALILLNLSTLTFMWINRPQRGPGPGGEGPGRYLMEEVGFTTDQREAYHKLMEEHRSITDSTNDSIRVYKKQLFSYLPSGNLSGAELTASSIARLQKKLELNTFNHFVKVRALCTTAEQTRKFDNTIEDVLKMMAPAGPRGKR